MFISDEWKDYNLIDANNGNRLEKWGDFVLVRPDPSAFWNLDSSAKWQNYDAIYLRSGSGGGEWNFNKTLPDKWQISYKDMKFWVKPMGFKHTGVFPEQATNWDFVRANLKKGDKVLNLFAYTGGATIAAALAGAEIVHVDASKGIIQMAKENAHINGLVNHPIRYIVDDCAKFVAREIRRGNKYDAIIMDPPSYGRGSNGEVWKIEDSLADLFQLCKQVLSDNAKFVLINSYTTGLSVGSISALAQMIFGGDIQSAELGLPVQTRSATLPGGGCVRILLN
ncbi:MAG: class I SAM-dependent methyltransferase [Oscillospiraceae bacterium]|nr:class I SAM-dependent methyltransferase [Oscillospiraceae bacterium]